MIEEILQLLGISLIIVILAVIFRDLKKEYSQMILVGGGIIITLWGLYKILPVVDYLKELSGTAPEEVQEYFSTIIKVLAISFIVQIGADICKDFGENSLATKIEFAGKAVMLATILPILKTVINMGLDLLK